MAKNLLHILLNGSQRFSANKNRTGLGQRDLSAPVNGAHQSLRYTTPEVNGQTVSRSHHVVWPRRKVHGNQLRIAYTVLKNLSPKSVRSRWVRYRLHIHVK